MAVMNVDEVFYCCLYGNNEDEVIIRHIDRDLHYEEELIGTGRVSGRTIFSPVRRLPTEDGNLILQQCQASFPGLLTIGAVELILEGMRIACPPVSGASGPAQRGKKRNYECIEAEMRRLQDRIVAEMGRAAWLSARDVKRLITASAISLCVNPVLVRKTCSVCRRSIRTSTSSTSLFRKAGASM